MRSGFGLCYHHPADPADVLALIQSELPILRGYGVERIGVFGSCAAGTKAHSLGAASISSRKTPSSQASGTESLLGPR